jgi:hypothetical protein
MNWKQDLLLSEERERQQRQGLDQAFGMYIDSVSGDSELAKVSFYGNSSRVVSLPQPFISVGSWIRAIPEAGAQMVGVYRAEEQVPQPIAMTQRNSTDRINVYRKGKGIYRPLNPGEIEMNSIGAGQVYLSRRARADMRGGITYRWADQDTLSVGDRAPVHTRQFFQFQNGTLGDEYRVGLVQRPTNTFEYNYPQVRGDYAAEEFLHMMNPNTNGGPDVLFTSARGHVLDDTGKQILQTVTQIPLRYNEVYYANDDSSTTVQIDEKGNYLTILATAATEGMELRVPSGYYRETIALDRIATVNSNDQLSVRHSGTWVLGETLRITTGQRTVSPNGPRITVESINNQSEGSRIIMDGTPGSETVTVSSISGHLLSMDDTVGSQAVYLIHNTGAQLNIDQNGSCKLISPDGNYLFLDATTGTASMASAAGAVISLQDSITFADSSGQNVFTFGGPTLQLSAGTNVVVAGQTMTIQAGTVNIGNNPIYSAVLAEQLAVLFDAHTHMTWAGPTSPPLPPTTAALFNANPATAFAAAFVKLRGNIV